MVRVTRTSDSTVLDHAVDDGGVAIDQHGASSRIARDTGVATDVRDTNNTIDRGSTDTGRTTEASSGPPAPPPPPPPTGGLTLPLPTGMTVVPYQADTFGADPWNDPIGTNPTIDPSSATWLPNIHMTSLSVTSFTLPFYSARGSQIAKTTFTASGAAKIVQPGASSGTYTISDAPNKQLAVPMPAGAAAAAGSDGQIIVVDLDTGDSYDMWQVSGTTCTNMTKFVGGVLSPGTAYGNPLDAAPDMTYVSRGAGVPYLTGLIRPWEVSQGHIDHALAFAYNHPSSGHRYPATKSDGTSDGMPEGARLQLDPAYDITQLTDPVIRMIAKALQVYGAYLIDFAGNSGKIYGEYQTTAQWNTTGHPSWPSGFPANWPHNSIRVLSKWNTGTPVGGTTTPTFMSRPSSGVLSYDGVASVTISNKAIRGSTSVSAPAGIGITIKNVSGPITITDVDLENLVGGIYLYNCTGTIVIDGVRSRNIGDGTIGAGHSNHIQFAECHISGYVRNSKFLGGRTEDMLSTWHTGGKGTGQELIFENNQLQGLVADTSTARAWTSSSGTGTILGDGAGSPNNGYIIVRNSTYLTPGQVGFQFIDGPGLQVYGNTILGQQRTGNNNSATSWEGTPVGVYRDNRWYWTNADGTHPAPWFQGGTNPQITESGNIIDSSLSAAALAITL